MATSTQPFQIKDFDAITNSLLGYIYGSDNQLTDYNVGSAMRSMLEAIASEHEETYYRLWQGIQTAIQQSILQTFNFTPQQATSASGTVQFSRETPALSPIIIPQGTILQSASGYLYTTTASTTIAVGATSATTGIVATTAGSATNIYGQGVVLTMQNPIYGVSTVTTVTQITGGQDVENIQSVLNRFTLFINSLTRGTTTALEYGALTANLTDSNGNITEEVQQAVAIDNSPSVGNVAIYIDNGTGTASTNLIAQAQKIIDGYYDANGNPVSGYKSAGVIATVSAVTAVQQAITVAIQTNYFSIAKPLVQSAITNYIQSLQIGQMLDYNYLISITIGAHYSITDCTFTSPTANVTVANNQRIILSSLTITQET